jgi:hypothetical protein
VPANSAGLWSSWSLSIQWGGPNKTVQLWLTGATRDVLHPPHGAHNLLNESNEERGALDTKHSRREYIRKYSTLYTLGNVARMFSLIPDKDTTIRDWNLLESNSSCKLLNSSEISSNTRDLSIEKFVRTSWWIPLWQSSRHWYFLSLWSLTEIYWEFIFWKRLIRISLLVLLKCHFGASIDLLSLILQDSGGLFRCVKALGGLLVCLREWDISFQRYTTLPVEVWKSITDIGC